MNKKQRRIVIKIGTSTLTNDQGMIDRDFITSLVRQIATLKSNGQQVLLVTSGAIRAGMERMGLSERPKTIPEKQATAAVGQGHLMHVYSEIFEKHGIITGQVLLTREDFGHRKRYLCARNTMITLFKHGVVPIINENDTVAIDEIKVGDNDNLAALVASSIQADLLILLSDVEGLYDAHPDVSGAKIISEITNIDSNLRKVAGGAGTVGGTGGMRTKLEAAEIAMSSGVKMVIAEGRRPDVAVDIILGKNIGTTFVPRADCLCGRKRWLAFGASSHGAIVVNEGAKKMIADRGKSLLAAGITEAIGNFTCGDMVTVLDTEGNPFARGFVNYSAGEIENIKGRQSSEIESLLGHKDFDEVIHRDNLVLQPEE